MNGAINEEQLLSIWAIEEKNKQVVRRFYEKLIKQGDFGTTDEIVAVDYELTSPSGHLIAPGREGLKNLYMILAMAFPCLHIEIGEVVAEGDIVAAKFKARGTHEGDLFGLKATGKNWSLEGVDFFKLNNGKIIEQWNLVDRLSILRQLGTNC